MPRSVWNGVHTSQQTPVPRRLDPRWALRLRAAWCAVPPARPHLLLAALALAAACGGCGDRGPKAEPRRATRTPRVGVIQAATRDLSYAVAAMGTLEAYQ